jgi:SAM-dependent methyltransferase
MLESLMPAEFVALDLACGSGAISQRLLTRFSQARCIAVDLDPFLLTIGRQTLGDMHGRLRWAEADLNTPAWIEALGVAQVDAVLSTTALHWLRNDVLARVYHQLAQLLRPGGVFLNGDHMKFAAYLGTFNQVVAMLKTKRYEMAFTQQGIEDWEQWWAAAQAEPAFAELLAERERRFAQRERDWVRAGYDFHKSALYEAGFREVDTIWQYLDNRVLMAVR